MNSSSDEPRNTDEVAEILAREVMGHEALLGAQLGTMTSGTREHEFVHVSTCCTETIQVVARGTNQHRAQHSVMENEIE